MERTVSSSHQIGISLLKLLCSNVALQSCIACTIALRLPIGQRWVGGGLDVSREVSAIHLGSHRKPQKNWNLLEVAHFRAPFY